MSESHKMLRKDNDICDLQGNVSCPVCSPSFLLQTPAERSLYLQQAHPSIIKKASDEGN